MLDRGPEGRAGVPVDACAFASDAASLLAAVAARVPPRLPVTPRPVAPGTILDLFDPSATPAARPAAPKPDPKPASKPAPKAAPKARAEAPKARNFGPVAELAYLASPFGDAAGATAAGPYEQWRPRTLRIAGARAHSTPLVQSGAIATVPHPTPAYRPTRPGQAHGLHHRDRLVASARLRS